MPILLFFKFSISAIFFKDFSLNSCSFFHSSHIENINLLEVKYAFTAIEAPGVFIFHTLMRTEYQINV